ncbi:hypothetical protein HUT19_35880 [Streptomyces sp. NA02950]|uniref:hypothetical protein n=1 Tax=Streptomyces sp. NA02950 TaxID=2742137 RepID=UPI0015923E4C|nr:hypothetical protein [Streptomyces sp. NA02950]QKV96429.1 hypothetical protein HUT19_35880 [Streptomyces sp. NA02950]
MSSQDTIEHTDAGEGTAPGGDAGTPPKKVSGCAVAVAVHRRPLRPADRSRRGPYDSDGPDDGTDIDWLSDDEANRRLRPSLGEGETVRVPVRVRADTKATPVTVGGKPPGDDFRDTARWGFTLY